MAILVTRPAPDNAATARALQELGYEPLLAPLMRCEALGLDDGAMGDTTGYAGVIVTSANALRAVAVESACARLAQLPCFAVGTHTAAAARSAGFADIHLASEAGDRKAEALPRLIRAHYGRRKPRPHLIYLAGSEITRDLAADLAQDDVVVETRTVYRMVPLPQLPADAIAAFAAGRIDAVLHYSKRTANLFVTAVRAAGLEISALALPHCCLSDAIAVVLREAGALRATVAARPEEDALLESLARLVPTGTGRR